MKQMVNRTVLAALMVSPFAAEAASALKSPYFIDGLHCEGLEKNIAKDTTMIGHMFKDEGGAKRAIRLANQIQCEAVFKRYGIEQLTWLTQSTLENLEFNLQNTNEFKNVSIHIKKSEIKNHVHLFAEFTEHKSAHFIEVEMKSSFENGRGEEGSRRSTMLGATYHLERRGPADLASAEYYVGRRITSASTPVDVEGNLDLGETEKLALENTDESSGVFGIRGKLFRKFSTGHEWYYDMGIYSNRLNRDETSSHALNFETGAQAISSFKNLKHVVKQKYYLMYSGLELGSHESILLDDDGKRKNDPSGSIVSAGFDLSSISKTGLSIEASFLRSLTSEMHYTFYEKVDYGFDEIFGLGTNLGIKFSDVKGAFLVEDRFMLADSKKLAVFAGINKSFTAFNLSHDLGLEIGTRSYASDGVNRGEERFSRHGNYAEINYKLENEHFSTKLGFLYGTRLY